MQTCNNIRRRRLVTYVPQQRFASVVPAATIASLRYKSGGISTPQYIRRFHCPPLQCVALLSCARDIGRLAGPAYLCLGRVPFVIANSDTGSPTDHLAPSQEAQSALELHPMYVSHREIFIYHELFADDVSDYRRYSTFSQRRQSIMDNRWSDSNVISELSRTLRPKFPSQGKQVS